MLREIERGDDQALAVANIVARIKPDILALLGVDYDAELQGLNALQKVITAAGHPMPHAFSRKPNSGMATSLDLDGDGKTGTPRDAQGYGRFAGADGNAVLSRFPFLDQDVEDFTALLWKDLPSPRLPQSNSKPFPSTEAQNIQRLSSTNHWVVPIEVGETIISLGVWAATPPVFDGPEDRNGKRNADENAFWKHWLNGKLGSPPTKNFILAGSANIDPYQGEGYRDEIITLLSHPRLNDPKPQSPENGTNTVDWPDPAPGDMRVDYILPSSDLRVLDAAVFWPDEPDMISHNGTPASRHHLVWVDIELP